MVAIDSLTLLKEEAVHIGKFSGDSYLCLINAFKNMVYAAHFDQKNALVSPIAMTLPQLHDLALSLPNKVLGLGDGFTAFAEFLQPALMSKIHRSILYPDFPFASTLARMAEKNALRCQTLDWKTFKPLYIRASAAEENLKLKK